MKKTASVKVFSNPLLSNPIKERELHGFSLASVIDLFLSDDLYALNSIDPESPLYSSCKALNSNWFLQCLNLITSTEQFWFTLLEQLKLLLSKGGNIYQTKIKIRLLRFFDCWIEVDSMSYISLFIKQRATTSLIELFLPCLKDQLLSELQKRLVQLFKRRVVTKRRGSAQDIINHASASNHNNTKSKSSNLISFSNRKLSSPSPTVEHVKSTKTKQSPALRRRNASAEQLLLSHKNSNNDSSSKFIIDSDPSSNNTTTATATTTFSPDLSRKVKFNNSSSLVSGDATDIISDFNNNANSNADIEKVAKWLTEFDYNMITTSTPTDIWYSVLCSSSSCSGRVRNIGKDLKEKFSETFNCISEWVAASVLNPMPNYEEDIDVDELDEEYLTKKSNRICNLIANRIKKFIKLALILESLRNFNCVAKIIAGLNHTSIARLKQSWDRIGKKYLSVFERLDSLVSPANNYAHYRKALQNAVLPAIPFIAVHTKDLWVLHQNCNSFHLDMKCSTPRSQGAIHSLNLEHIHSIGTILEDSIFKPVRLVYNFIVSPLKSKHSIAKELVGFNAASFKNQLQCANIRKTDDETLWQRSVSLFSGNASKIVVEDLSNGSSSEEEELEECSADAPQSLIPGIFGASLPKIDFDVPNSVLSPVKSNWKEWAEANKTVVADIMGEDYELMESSVVRRPPVADSKATKSANKSSKKSKQSQKKRKAPLAPLATMLIKGKSKDQPNTKSNKQSTSSKKSSSSSTSASDSPLSGEKAEQKNVPRSRRKQSLIPGIFDPVLPSTKTFDVPREVLAPVKSNWAEWAAKNPDIISQIHKKDPNGV